MKKTIITLLAVVGCVAFASAQNAERTEGKLNKKGQNILPAKGDFAIGVDATPFLEYIGSMLGSGSAPEFKGYDGRIYGKYFLKDNQAIRFGLELEIGGTLDKYKVTDEAAIVADPTDIYASTFDKRNATKSNVAIFGGYEWRRGYGRLQGFWGGEASIGFTTGKTTYEWGNAMTITNQTPESANWSGTISHPGTRTLVSKTGPGFRGGLRGFAGVEYFFARKMSIGGELGFGFLYDGTGQATTTTQSFNSSTNRIEELTLRNPGYNGDRNWGFNTQVTGNIFLMFHF